jgi:hypothetical protein
VNYLETPNGQKIQLNVPGDQIFLGSGTNSVFGALNNLVADYSSGTVNTAQAVSDTTALSTALNYVSQQRVTIDNSITQVTAASERRDQRATQLTTAQTNLMQADVAKVSTQLSLDRDPADGARRCDRATEFVLERPVQQAAGVKAGVRDQRSEIRDQRSDELSALFSECHAFFRR